MSKSQHILLANPNEKNRFLVKRALNERGFNNIEETPGDQHCINLLNKTSFDAVILNVELGSLDAWRLTRLIRSGVLTTNERTPVFIVSPTFSEQIALATAKEFEVNAFIPLNEAERLPIELEEIFSTGKTEPKKSSVLIIEDYADTAKLVERVLKHRFSIETAADGEAGLNAWVKGRHDIVLLDLMLPKMSGEEVLREILKVKPTQSIVMMTAFGSAEKAGDLIASGAVDFISKPFRAEQLRNVCNIAAHREDYIVSNQQFAQRQAELVSEKERALVTLKSIGDGVITTNAKGEVEYLNPIAEHLTGWLNEEAHGKALGSIFKTFHEYSRVPAVNPLERCLAENRAIHSKSNIILRSRQGQEMVIEHSASPIKGMNDEALGAVMVFQDSTEARNLEKQLTYHASHDPLTGLKNRQIFDQEVQIALEDCHNANVQHALCHLDINELKMINESRGHVAGDKLLQEVAQLLTNMVRSPSDAVARLGGHEFGLLLRHCPIDAATRICENIAKAFEDYTFTWLDVDYKITAAIGICNVDDKSPELLDIFAASQAAAFKAKDRGGNRVHIFSEDDADVLQRRTEVQLASEILQAEQENRFELWCQPIQSLARPNEISYEILIRMRDKNGGIVSPAFFLPSAERFNLIASIDRWVIRNTFIWLHKNPENMAKITHCGINLSGITLGDETFYDYIIAQFEEFKIPHDKICFEITETAAVKNFTLAGSFITAIRDLGCKFALDDFGTGMSSFAYLKKLPVDFLKIDGIFVKDLLENPIDLAMVRSINDIGHVSGLQTIAEFVENDAIAKELEAVGVDYLQGYGISKPFPLDELTQYVEKLCPA